MAMFNHIRNYVEATTETPQQRNKGQIGRVVENVRTEWGRDESIHIFRQLERHVMAVLIM